jgi:hypothetical protein
MLTAPGPTPIHQIEVRRLEYEVALVRYMKVLADRTTGAVFDRGDPAASQPPSRPSKAGFSFYLLSGALGCAAAGALEAAGSGSLLTPEESGISRQSSE